MENPLPESSFHQIRILYGPADNVLLNPDESGTCRDSLSRLCKAEMRSKPAGCSPADSGRNSYFSICTAAPNLPSTVRERVILPWQRTRMFSASVISEGIVTVSSTESPSVKADSV